MWAYNRNEVMVQGVVGGDALHLQSGGDFKENLEWKILPETITSADHPWTFQAPGGDPIPY